VSDPVDVTFPNGIGGRGPLGAPITFTPKADADGILTATVWNDKGEPLAERLIYRQPAHEVKVAVTPSQTSYTPGGKATLNIQTTDETGKPISAVVGLTVTDDSVLEMIEKREQAPRLPVMVFLEPEVKDLADAHVYLDPHNPKAALATDLLLGTQGWRRFATYRAEEFMAKYGDDAKRVLAFVKPEPQVFAFDELGMKMEGVQLAGAMRGGAIVPAAPQAAMPVKGANIEVADEKSKVLPANKEQAKPLAKVAADEDLRMDHLAVAAEIEAPGGVGGFMGGRGPAPPPTTATGGFGPHGRGTRIRPCLAAQLVADRSL
jgi:hypothetical protein